MSGGRPFEYRRLVALADLVRTQRPDLGSDALAVLLWRMDFDAYAKLGRSLTGATWMKGTWHRPVYVRELGERWFLRYMRARTPRWVRALGDCATAVLLARMLWDRAARR